ncbi:hypothetical protein ACFQ88_00370 [Paenibacillus sp. NPDC056579]|uniref:hypothetical protein n=1 Tax=Paenibacillus sp. NPDC056579 TaxID=3345871 RepID=UPI0036B56C91
MDRSLNRTDYLFVLTFIFMLVLSVGTFFMGLKLGQERSAAKYEELFSKQNEAAKGYSAYHQQYLVSYYHTIYEPYREFQQSWFDKTHELEINRSADASLILKDLGKLAKAKYDAVSSTSMPDSSPLLQQGQQNYAKSLKLFHEALTSFQAKANSIPGSELVKAMNSDPYFTEARKFALAAQSNYYESIVKWNESENPQFKHAGKDNPLAIAEWNTLSLNVKNLYIASKLAQDNVFKPFTPQDLSMKIDEMIASGQSGKMNLSQVQNVIDVLLATNAVGSGDFARNKTRWYANETLPQIPFFASAN